MAQLGYIQIIRKCNQQCLFCSSPTNDLILDCKKIIREIDNYKKENCSGIILTGGEPTLHPDILKLISYCDKNDLEVRLITNGQLTADYSFLEKLQKKGLSLMHVSLHSVSFKIQNFLSQNNNSFKNIIQKLINAKKLEVPVNINTVINSRNAKNLDKNAQFLLKNFSEIKHYIFNNLDPENNRVIENKFLVPKLNNFKDSLARALRLLIKFKKTFRVEMVPLCYMLNFAEFSTETRKIVKDEKRILKFLDERQKPFLVQNKNHFHYDYGKVCKKCSLRDICAGVHGLGVYYSEKELQPQSINPNIIINKILNG